MNTYLVSRMSDATHRFPSYRWALCFKRMCFALTFPRGACVTLSRGVIVRAPFKRRPKRESRKVYRAALFVPRSRGESLARRVMNQGSARVETARRLQEAAR